MLAGATTNAGILVDGWHRGREVVVRVAGHHLDGSGRTMTGAVAAFSLAQGRDTEVDSHHSVTNLDASFLFFIDRLDGASRTHF